jgi:hypothetical protein
MLVLREVHAVVGLHEDEFEAAYRDEYAPALAADGDHARLLHFLHHAHGSGSSYRVVTLTAFRDAAAYDRVRQRVEQGDLRTWTERVDDLRHDVEGKFLVPVPWSPVQDHDLAAIPAASDHAPAVYMEDTVWPHEGKLEAYIERAGTHYAGWMASTEHAPNAMLRIEAAYRTAFGSGRRREIVLTQRVIKPDRLMHLLTAEMLPEHKQPGTWMHDGLEFRDQWESRLLRSSRWSPVP